MSLEIRLTCDHCGKVSEGSTASWFKLGIGERRVSIGPSYASFKSALQTKDLCCEAHVMYEVAQVLKDLLDAPQPDVGGRPHK